MVWVSLRPKTDSYANLLIREPKQEHAYKICA
jgi:hypothetical protein